MDCVIINPETPPKLLMSTILLLDELSAQFITQDVADSPTPVHNSIPSFVPINH